MTHMIEEICYLVARFEYGETVLVNLPTVAREVAAVLTRPCFAAADVLSAWRKERLLRPAQPTAERIVEYLSDSANDGIMLGVPGNPAIDIDNGNGRERSKLRTTSLRAYVVFSMTEKIQVELLRGVCDLARALRAASGFVAIDSRYNRAFQVALVGPVRARAGLGDQRQNERDARWLRSERLGTELAGIEWGTFLGRDHLARIDLDEVRASGAFAGVLRLSNELAYLQVTHDPADDLTGVLEEKLPAARRALAPLMMDLSDAEWTRRDKE